MVFSYKCGLLQKTTTKAVVEMAGNQTIQDGGFQLLILLAELHVPRMWVEQHPDDPDSRVCYFALFCPLINLLLVFIATASVISYGCTVGR